MPPKSKPHRLRLFVEDRQDYPKRRLQWRSSLHAGNGRIVFTSGGDGYNNRKDCLEEALICFDWLDVATLTGFPPERNYGR